MASSTRQILDQNGDPIGSALFFERFEVLEIGSVDLFHWKIDDTWDGLDSDISTGYIRSLTPEEIEEAKVRLADCKFGAEEIIVDLKD